MKHQEQKRAAAASSLLLKSVSKASNTKAAFPRLSASLHSPSVHAPNTALRRIHLSSLQTMKAQVLQCAEEPYSDRNIETCPTKRSGYWYCEPWLATG